jgi:hypothetical protein
MERGKTSSILLEEMLFPGASSMFETLDASQAGDREVSSDGHGTFPGQR